jgi:Holliday junction resolvase RusA-like endonuclease
MLKIFKICPQPKPRMTRSDRWRTRPSVLAYRAFADEMRSQSDGWELPDAFHVRFIVPMPRSWSNKKKLQMVSTPHRQRPDLDNFIKSFDCLREEDSSIWKISAEKIWGEEGAIIIDDLQDG